MRRGRRLATRTGSRFRGQAEELVRQAERLAELDRRLSTGKPEPANAEEARELADVCFRKKRYAEAVEYYRRAFDRDPNRAANVSRYRAACATALAAAGRGEAIATLDAARRSGLRKQALAWLRQDLDAWRRKSADPKARLPAEATLRHWQRHPDLASLRDPAAVARLPEDERHAFKQLWADVNTLLSEIQPD
jgi:tetratricopeptide (TPR) repeat protein